jgi:hypothetical protein
MKSFKEYLLLALALILGAIALFRLTQGEPLFVPVHEVTITKKESVTAKPLIERGDVKEKDPLGLLGTTLYFTTPKGMHPSQAEIFGKTYPVRNGSVKVERKVSAPLTITLIEQKRFCAIPKEAAVKIEDKVFVLTKKGVVEVKEARPFNDELYFLPPCPKEVAIGSDLDKKVKEALTQK